jgi:hypothetical protein
VQELAKHFVAAADEVYRLQSEKDSDCLFFQQATKGIHTNGDDPTDSMQGIYVIAPAGKTLAAKNSLDAGEVCDLLEKGLAAWKELPKKDRLAEKLPEKPSRRDDYPRDGLALSVFARDLPREGRETKLWNQDRVWFRKNELTVPLEAGASGDAPLMAKRLAMTGFLDYVRGETEHFEPKHVEEASLAMTVRSVQGSLVTLRLTGKTKTHAEGTWPVAGFKDMDKPTKQKRGITLALEGEAVFDTAKARFTKFELAAVGTRFGGTQYNDRSKDLLEAPIGFWVELAPSEDRVAPTWLDTYEWPAEPAKTWR